MRRGDEGGPGGQRVWVVGSRGVAAYVGEGLGARGEGGWREELGAAAAASPGLPLGSGARTTACALGRRTSAQGLVAVGRGTDIVCFICEIKPDSSSMSGKPSIVSEGIAARVGPDMGMSDTNWPREAMGAKASMAASLRSGENVRGGRAMSGVGGLSATAAGRERESPLGSLDCFLHCSPCWLCPVWMKFAERMSCRLWSWLAVDAAHTRASVWSVAMPPGAVLAKLDTWTIVERTSKQEASFALGLDLRELGLQDVDELGKAAEGEQHDRWEGGRTAG